MQIEAISKRKVKASARSLTCKDENGKTCGIVHAVRFTDLPPREQSEHWKVMKTSGLWAAGEAKNTYLSGGKLYYINDLRRIEQYEKYFAGKAGFEQESQNYESPKALVQKAAEYMAVIDCYAV